MARILPGRRRNSASAAARPASSASSLLDLFDHATERLMAACN